MDNVGVKVRLHDLTGDDLGIAHVPWPVELGDLVATDHGEYHIVDIVETGRMLPLAALCKVRPARLAVVAR